jgi:hypothetical protein
MRSEKWEVLSRRTAVRGQRVLVTCLVKWEVRSEKWEVRSEK